MNILKLNVAAFSSFLFLLFAVIDTAAGGDYKLYNEDGISLDHLQGDPVQTLIKRDDDAKKLSLDPASKQTATRTFQVELIPGGVTRLIQYSVRRWR